MKTKLQAFLYILMRDELVAGKVEKIMRDHVEKTVGQEVHFCNQHLANYAEEIAQTLVASPAEEIAKTLGAPPVKGTAAELVTLVKHFFDSTLPAMSDPGIQYVIRYDVGTGECSVTQERKR